MKNTTHFTKMHALGNDFVILNNIKQKINLTKELICPLDTGHCKGSHSNNSDQ